VKAKSATLNAEIHRARRGEIILIRAGQHLFREWRKGGRGDKVLEAAFEEIFRAKRLLRADTAKLQEMDKERHRTTRGCRKANKNASAAA